MLCMFLKEKMSKKRILSLIIGTIGVLFALQILPAVSIVGINLVGVGIMLLSAILWAVCLIVGQGLLKKYHAFTILFYNFLLGLIVYCLLQSPIITISQITISASVLFYIAIMGIVSTFIAYLFLYFAVKRIGASNMGIINLTQPFLSIAFAFMLLGQTTTIFQILGIGFVIFSVYLLYKEHA